MSFLCSEGVGVGLNVLGNGGNVDGSSHKVYDNRIQEPGFEFIQANQKSKFVILDNIFYVSFIDKDGMKVVDAKRHSYYENGRELNYIVIQPDGQLLQMDAYEYSACSKSFCLTIY